MKRPVMLLAASACLALVQPAVAQDPVKLSPHMYRVLLENEHVRVLEFRAKAGDKEPMHSHPAAVIYVLSPGKARFTTPDGKSEERESSAGTTLWSDPVTHAYEYLGPGDARVVIVEMKTQAKAPGGDGKAR